MSSRPFVPHARIVSVILHPIFIPVLYGLIAFPFRGPYLGLKLIIFIFLFLIPTAVTFLWLRIKWDKDVFVVDRANRIVPLISLLICTAFFAVACGSLLPDELYQGKLMALLMLLAFFSLIVTLSWKISLHMIGWGALAAGGLIGDYMFNHLWFIPAVFIATVAAAWGRMYLRSHDWAQLIAGWVLGFGLHTGLQAAW